jgi:hypothetical protein
MHVTLQGCVARRQCFDCFITVDVSRQHYMWLVETTGKEEEAYEKPPAAAAPLLRPVLCASLVSGTQHYMPCTCCSRRNWAFGCIAV